MIKLLITVILLAGLIFSVGCTSSHEITDKPVTFSEERTELTKQYIKTHYGLDVNSIEIVPKVIVLHWTAVGDFDKSFDIFERQVLGSCLTRFFISPARRLSGGELPVINNHLFFLFAMF